jgi:site-specific DNA-cytosine methylase
MINVLSLFDGISVGKVALDKLGLEINKDYKYYASEIDKTAIKCSEANHVGIIRLGDVHKVSFKDGTLFTENGNFKVGSIDLICGGSPCQSFSPLAVSTGNYKGLKGKSGLFYEYLRILKEIQLENPGVKFLLENVKMAKANKVELDKYLGCEGVLINSSLVLLSILGLSSILSSIIDKIFLSNPKLFSALATAEVNTLRIILAASLFRLFNIFYIVTYLNIKIIHTFF